MFMHCSFVLDPPAVQDWLTHVAGQLATAPVSAVLLGLSHTLWFFPTYILAYVLCWFVLYAQIAQLAVLVAQQRLQQQRAQQKGVVMALDTDIKKVSIHFHSFIILNVHAMHMFILPMPAACILAALQMQSQDGITFVSQEVHRVMLWTVFFMQALAAGLLPRIGADVSPWQP
jgi:hypothetical protein